MFNQTSKKFIGGFVGIIVLGLLVWYASAYLSPEARQARQEREALQYIVDLEEQYENDTYGGETPEETLALFIQALENEDIELASKYFLPEDREEMLSDLEIAQQQQGDLSGVISRIKGLDRTTGEHNMSETAFFIAVGQDNVVKHQVVLKKNQNGVWKITEL